MTDILETDAVAGGVAGETVGGAVAVGDSGADVYNSGTSVAANEADTGAVVYDAGTQEAENRASNNKPAPIEGAIAGYGGRGGWISPIRDSERARELGKRGHAVRALRKAISQVDTMRGWRKGVASIEPGITTFREAYRSTVAQVALAAHEGDSKAFRELSIAAGLRDVDKAAGDTVAEGGVTIHIGGDVAAGLLALAAEAVRRRG